eukprot:jgi/Ulvmu1/2309/UM013_0157.1
MSPAIIDLLLSDPTYGTCSKPQSQAGRAHAQPRARRRIPVDVLEKDEQFEVLADVPGVQKAAISLAIDHHTLTISVSHPDVTSATPATPAVDTLAAAEAAPVTADAASGPDAAVAAAEVEKAAEPKVLRRERAQRFAARSLQFPEAADLEAAQAECEAGVLRVSIPKKALPQPSRIRVA